MKPGYTLIICILIFVIGFCLYNTNPNINNINEAFTSQNKVVCLYAYYEKDDLYKSNLQYFLDNGILENVDYYFIVNGDSTIEFLKKDNIKVIYRENKGYDFGAYSHTITNYVNKEYDYYVFMNASVCGPYISPTKYQNKNWLEIFLELFNDSTKPKIVGTSINLYNNNIFDTTDLKTIYGNKKVFAHIQSMFFILDNEYYNYLKNKQFFNDEIELNKISNINDIILNKEFKLSQLALNNNWNINCILPKYRELDYINIKKDINNTSSNGDPYYKNAYFGKTINKQDVIFFKTNRIL